MEEVEEKRKKALKEVPWTGKKGMWYMEEGEG